METPKPQAEHEWLQQLIGNWTFEAECVMAPGQAPTQSTGTVAYRSLGGLWILGEATGMCESIITLGYDPAAKKFVGSFIAAMMTHFWPYEGTLAGNVLTLDSTGPSFSGDGTMAKYQDIIEILGKDEHTLTAHAPGPDGGWSQFMKTRYTRAK